MCHVHIDMPHLLVMLVDHQDFLGRLDEDRNVEGGSSTEPPGRQPASSVHRAHREFAFDTSSLALRICSTARVSERGWSESATRRSAGSDRLERLEQRDGQDQNATRAGTASGGR